MRSTLRTNKLLVKGTLLVVGCAALAALLWTRDAAPLPKAVQLSMVVVDPHAPADGAAPALPPITAPVPDRKVTLPPPPIHLSRARKKSPDEPIVEAAIPPPPVEPPPVEPASVRLALEREALSYVGVDAVAEAVWVEAINDPDISAHDRSDLIEDLNEEGFADPRAPTIDELPMILNRLAIIEELAPDAMDDVNADAFAEAHKDLINMYLRLTAEE